MRGEGGSKPPDVRFGVALPDAWGAFATPADHFGTLELPLESFLGRSVGATALAAALPASADLCIRLGPDFLGPALAGGYAELDEVAYRRAVAACRLAAGDPALQGLVAAYLLEFPSSIPYGPASRRHLDRVLRDLGGLPLAVAFYGVGWYSVRVVEGLKERGAALCLLDLPRGPSGLPSIDVVTAPLVYIKRWDGGPSGAWIPRLEALAAQAETLRVLVAANGPASGDLCAAADQAAAMRAAWALRAVALAAAMPVEDV